MYHSRKSDMREPTLHLRGEYQASNNTLGHLSFLCVEGYAVHYR